MIKVVFCLFFSICNLFANQTIIVGIAGGTGSGKTTLAEKIHTNFPESILINQDSYYKDISHLTLNERKNVNFDHPNSLEFALLSKHLIDLKQGHTVNIPIYDFCSHSRTDKTHKINPSNIIIVEGILLLSINELRDLFDLKIFVDTDSDVRILRRIERDIKERGRILNEIKNQYLTTVKPMHDIFVEPSKKFADIIVNGNEQNTMAISLILAKLSIYK